MGILLLRVGTLQQKKSLVLQLIPQNLNKSLYGLLDKGTAGLCIRYIFLFVMAHFLLLF